MLMIMIVLMILILILVLILILILQRRLYPAGCGGMMVVVPGGFELPDHHGKDQADRQGHGEFEPVMDMELQLRQKIARRDADESPGGKSEGASKKDMAFLGVLACPEVKQDHTQRNDQRERGVHQMPQGTRPAAGGHQRADRQRVKGFVQENDQECAQPQEHPGAALRFRLDTGTQSDAVDEGMKRQPQRGADPG